MGRFKEEIVQRITTTLMDRLENEMDSIGVEMDEFIRDMISTPVVRSDAGVVIQRSEPGEYPWLETGHLRASQGPAELDRTGPTRVRLKIINHAEYARRLHYNPYRPFFTLAFKEWLPLFPGRILAALAGKR